jgi:ppGpp synthetase/RelA/SpoT-type nucleotidyltranferase
MDLVKHINHLTEGFISVPKQPWTTKEEALALAEQALPAFRRILLRAAPSNAIVKVAIKPVESIDDKLQRWKSAGRGIDTMFDMLRGAVLVSHGEEIQDTIHRLSRGPVVAKFEHKDEPKDALGYYGSYHLDLYLPQFKMVAEIQVMTKKLWAYKKAAHQIYKEQRSKPAIDPAAASKSRELYRAGNRPKIPTAQKPERVDPAVLKAARRGEHPDQSD